jgi:predicted ATPase
MKRYILTGTPGAGKTVILRQLELNGFGVVEEAATDLIALWQAHDIAEPWREDSFLDAVAELQKQRQLRAASEPVAIQFYDR